MADAQKQIAKAFAKAQDNLVSFRQLFFPVDNEVAPAWFHYTWSDILLHGDKHFAVEGFRECSKSSYVTGAFPCYCLSFPSKERQYIVFVMANQRSASKKLKEIASNYTTNELLSLNLVKIIEQSEKAFEVIVKDTQSQEINVRIEAYGKGSAIRGLNWKDHRPSIILVDDPQDITDSQSDITQKNDWEWFLSDLYFLGKSTRIFFIGNNLGEKCLIERVFDGKELLNFDTLRIPVMDELGHSNWPERFPIDEIEQEKEKWRALGQLDIWEREKMCIAISPDRQMFRKEYFKYYADHELKKEGLSYYTTCDLAISEKESADFTVVLTIAVNSDNQWFIAELDYERMNPTKTIDTIFRHVQKFKPVCVGVERVAYQAALRHFLELEMPKRNIWFTIKDLEAQNKKELRIATLQPRFKAGSIWFQMGAPYLTELESELCSFPKGRHDDLIDALAYQSQIALPPVNAFNTVYDDDIFAAGSM